MIYVTGDCHGNFRRFQSECFPEQANMTKDDTVIITGDYIEKNIIPKSFILRCKCNNLKTFFGIIFLIL